MARSYEGAGRRWVELVVALHVMPPDLRHYITTCNVCAGNRQVFVVTAPGGCNKIGCKSDEPDVFAGVSRAGLACHRSIRQLGTNPGAILDHVLHNIKQFGYRFYGKDFVDFLVFYVNYLTLIILYTSKRLGFDRHSCSCKCGISS